MFIFIIIIVLILIAYFLIKRYLRKIYITEGVIKYKLLESDKSLFDKTSSKTPSKLFYTTTRWSALNNNYLHNTIDNRYYIIEPGYYYYITDGIKITSKEIDIYNFNYHNKISVIVK